MISDRQNRFYWRLWGMAKRRLMPGRETWTQREETNRRHELHVRVVGRDCSHYDLRQWEFTRVINEMRNIAEPAGAPNHNVQARDAERRRKYFGLRGLMRKLRVGEEYVQAISRRMFLGLEIGHLKAEELQKLIIALREHERRNAA
jgi:hypothetical protein